MCSDRDAEGTKTNQEEIICPQINTLASILLRDVDF